MDFLQGTQAASNIMGGLASLGGFAGTIKSLFGSHSAERRAIRNQKDLMNFSANLQDEMIRKQNQYNMDSWMKQNEYNSPVNQMKRLQEAGLNPNLVYGGSGSVAGNAGSIQSGSGVSLQGSSDSTKAQANEIMERQLDLQLMRQYKELGVLDSQIELNKSGANRNNKEADQVGPNSRKQRDYLDSMMGVNRSVVFLNDAETAFKDVQRCRENYFLGRMKRFEQSELDLLISELKLSEMNYDILRQEYDFKDQMNPLAIEEKNKTIQQIQANIKYTLNKAIEAISQAKMNDATRALVNERLYEMREMFDDVKEFQYWSAENQREDNILKKLAGNMDWLEATLTAKEINAYEMQKAMEWLSMLGGFIGNLGAVSSPAGRFPRGRGSYGSTYRGFNSPGWFGY